MHSSKRFKCQLCPIPCTIPVIKPCELSCDSNPQQHSGTSPRLTPWSPYILAHHRCEIAVSQSVHRTNSHCSHRYIPREPILNSKASDPFAGPFPVSTRAREEPGVVWLRLPIGPDRSMLSFCSRQCYRAALEQVQEEWVLQISCTFHASLIARLWIKILADRRVHVSSIMDGMAAWS